MKDVTDKARILASTWDMKKKANGLHRARLNAHGCEQFDGVNYDSANIASSVTKYMSIKIVLVLAITEAQKTKIIDLKG